MSYPDLKSQNAFDNYSVKSLSKIIRHARNAPFWREKLPADIASIEEFRQLPITTRSEITELCSSGRWAELLTTAPSKKHVIVTSGGRPYQPPFTSCLAKKEFEQMSLTIVNMLLDKGIRKGRILITFPGVMPYPAHFARKIRPRKDIVEYQSSHISGVLFKHASLHCDLETFCSGLRFLAYKISKEEAIIESERIMKAYSIAKPKILAVSPNVLRNVFLSELERREHGFDYYDTEVIISGGSKLLKEDYKRIRFLGNPKIILWIESGEVGTIGFSAAFPASQSEKPSHYYTTWRQNFFETVDSTGLPLPFGDRGRIVVTRLNTLIQPLIRYDLEDEGEFFIHQNEIVLGTNISKL